MISKASAPGKIILFGEHFVVYGTRAILATIDKRITVTAQTTVEQTISIESQLGSLTIGITQEGKNKKLRPFEFLAKKMLDRFSYDGGVKIKIESEIPQGVGLGSSSAACVAAAAAVSGLFAKYDRQEICELAIEAEKTIFENTSGADCTVCTFGGIIEYGKESGFNRYEDKSGLDLIIANSGIIHSTSEIVSKVSGFSDENPEEFESLCKKESQVIAKVKAKIQQRELVPLGELMKENQKYLERIGVSNDALRKIIRLTDRLCHGSKITGAGGGGCVIAVAEKNTIKEIMDNLKKQQISCFAAKIDYTGLDTF